jgi:hypothetical protein
VRPLIARSRADDIGDRRADVDTTAFRKTYRTRVSTRN